MPRAVWVSYLHCPGKNKRDWHPQSVGCKCSRHHNINKQRLFKACYCFYCDCNTCCVVGNEQMVTGLRLQNKHFMVGVCHCRNGCSTDSCINCELPGNKSSIGKSCEE